MKPQRRDIQDIPYQDMWEDDAIWLPKLIAKQFPIDMTFKFNEAGKLY